MTPGTFSDTHSRAAGFAGNSNIAALMMNLMCAAALKYPLDSRRFDALVLLVGGFGVFTTLSRSGMIAFVLILVCYLLLPFCFRSRKREFEMHSFLPCGCCSDCCSGGSDGYVRGEERRLRGDSPEFVCGRLAEHNIEARSLWNPLHHQPVFDGGSIFRDGTAERLYHSGVCPPRARRICGGFRILSPHCSDRV
jgi:hypothetical protein